MPEHTQFTRYFSADAHTEMRLGIDNQRVEIEAMDRLFQATAADFYKATA